MEGLTKTIPPFSFSLTLPLPLSPTSLSSSPFLAQVPTVSFSSTLPFILSVRLASTTHAYFSFWVRDALGIWEQSTLWFLRWDLGKHQWTSSNRSSVYSHSLLVCKWVLCGCWCHFTLGVVLWHHFTHCYQDVICFSSQWAPRAILKVWLYSGDTVVMRRHNLQKLFIAVRWWQHHKSHYLAGFEEKPTKPRHSRRAETHIERASQMQELKTVRWESGTDVSSLFECINH